MSPTPDTTTPLAILPAFANAPIPSATLGQANKVADGIEAMARANGLELTAQTVASIAMAVEIRRAVDGHVLGDAAQNVAVQLGVRLPHLPGGPAPMTQGEQILLLGLAVVARRILNGAI